MYIYAGKKEVVHKSHIHKINFFNVFKQLWRTLWPYGTSICILPYQKYFDFLDISQPNDRMLPFTAKELQVIMCTLLGCFMKEDRMDEATYRFTFPQDKISDNQICSTQEDQYPIFCKRICEWAGKKCYLPDKSLQQLTQLIHKDTQVKTAWKITSVILSGMLSDQHRHNTVEPLYNTIVFHQNTHKRHPIARP